jgi:WD40 repeat protein
LQFWEPLTHELLREAQLKGGGESIAFSLDGSRALVSHFGSISVFDTATWQNTGKKLEGDSFLPGARFIADGKYVAAPRSGSSLRFYDVQSWQSIDMLPEVPEGAVRFYPAPKTKRAIVQFKPGKVALWDTGKLHEVAVLSDDAQVHQVQFSPDESLVAIDLWGSNAGSSKFGIWNVTSGKLAHELHPFERLETRCTEGLLWSPDGRHLLAGTTVDLGSSNAVSVFNVKSGRQRAEFSGCTRINGLVLLRNGRQLVAGDEDGKIRFWKYSEAMEKIQAFEISLGEE